MVKEKGWESMNTTILLHGQWANSITGKILTEIQNVQDAIQGVVLDVVIVSYVKDTKSLRECFNRLGTLDYAVRIVEVKDLFNQGFYNVNRQIYTVRRGLEEIPTDHFVIKLRNDQIVNFRKLFYRLKRLHYLSDDSRKILTTNCYTRKHRLYHPSDMFLCGWQKDLLEYYSAPLMQETSAEWKLKMLMRLEEDADHFEEHYRSPESYLFSCYLRRKGWEFKNTEEDSFQAIRTCFHVLNSWDIDYCWNKQRVPGRQAGHLILPTSGKCPPFAWDTPVRDGTGNMYFETDGCYERSDFEGNRTKKDAYYVDLAERLYRKLLGK